MADRPELQPTIEERVVYSRAPMGLWTSITLPEPTKAELRWAWWENFFYCYGRLITFLVFWLLFYILIRATRG